MAAVPQALDLGSYSLMSLSIAPLPGLGIPDLLALSGTLYGWTHLTAPSQTPQVIISTWILLSCVWAPYYFLPNG